MTALLERSTVSPVGGTGEDAREGPELRQRRQTLGMSLRQMAEQSGINRATLKRVEEGGARGTSVGAYRAAVERLEHEIGMDMPDADDAPNDLDLVEFQVAGNFGVRVVVKGPVRDRHELEETVIRLIGRMQNEQGPQPPEA